MCTIYQADWAVISVERAWRSLTRRLKVGGNLLKQKRSEQERDGLLISSILFPQRLENKMKRWLMTTLGEGEAGWRAPVCPDREIRKYQCCHSVEAVLK